MVTTVAGIVANGILLGLVYAIAALGLSLIMGVMGIINVAHSAFIMLGSFLALGLLEWAHIDPIASFFIALPIFFVVGAVVYRLIVTRVERAHQTQGLIAMFGLMVLIENLGTIAWTTDTRVITVGYSNANLTVGPLIIADAPLIAGVLAVVLILALRLFLHSTMVGRAIRAMGQNRDAALSLGINVRRLSAIMFGLGIASAGAAGVALAMIFPFAPQTQIQWLAWAFLIVVLGGLGRVESTLVSALMVGLIQTAATAFLPFDYVYLILYVALATILSVRRQGLRGVARRAI
ncbi:MAG: branched-chain amino acid ABC transporter permease [Alphaproteobacteria bacterium]|nr:branched-chain amino acid ABC transporter permease [Alphaproteobacteria bacterium]